MVVQNIERKLVRIRRTYARFQETYENTALETNKKNDQGKTILDWQKTIQNFMCERNLSTEDYVDRRVILRKRVLNNRIINEKFY